LWRKAAVIYDSSFPEHGRKPEQIIRRMFRRKLCRLHLAFDGEETVAMALSGMDRQYEALVIDYLAVAESRRGTGLGRRFLESIRQETAEREICRGIIVEAEAEETPVNLGRIRFWQSCGFKLTDYVHQYIWVPEPYRALVLSLPEMEPLPEDGRELFGAIIRFHEQAYRR
jgi:GNAT superfamily N-acetyltransferase